MQERQPIFTFSVLDSTDSATTVDIDDFGEDGLTLAPELRLSTCFFGLPGHQLLGATWSSRDVAILDQNFRILLPGPFGVPAEAGSDSWSVYYNFDQYVVVDPCDPTRGWGIFGRAGFADKETNPVEWFVSVGLGGSSPICGRERDTWGIGYYYAGTSDELPEVLNLNDGDGFELFYNMEVTPWFHLTADLQIIDQGFGGIPALGVDGPDTAIVLGLRGKIDF